MRTPLLVIASLALFTTTVRADASAPKYTRKQHVAIDVKLSNRVKPIEPKARPGRPLSGTEALLIEERKLVLRVDQEKLLEQLVKDTPDDDPDKADLLFRLAEHYAKSQRFWRLKSIQLSQP